MNTSIQNVTTSVDDGRVAISWEPVQNADGYKLIIYSDPEYKQVFRVRYAENCSKTLLGFTNGSTYYLKVIPFTKIEGTEKLLPASDIVEFVTMSKKLKTNKSVLVLKSEETFQFECEKLNQKITDVSYISEDPSIASVSPDGLVTAHKKGTTSITARDENTNHRTELVIPIYVDRDADAAPKTYGSSFVTDNGTYVSSRNACTISLVGDLMCTGASQRQARRDGLYDFTDSFVHVRRMLRDSDLNIGILETCVDHNSLYESEQKRLENGGPNCNSPAAFLDALHYAGFNGLVTANNHCCDCGPDGLVETIHQIESRSIANIGCKMEEGTTSQIFDINGIRIAVLAYSCVSNRARQSFKDSHSEYMLADYSLDRAEREIRDVRQEQQADYVIVYMHWGVMNSYQVTVQQKKAAKELVEAGADFIAGSHPHLLQQFEYLEHNGKKVPCIYSMGNFFTSMTELSGNRDGIIVRLTVHKSSEISADVELIPTYTADIQSYAVPVPCYSSAYSNDILQSAVKRIHSALYPASKDSRESLSAITIGRLITETGGRPNFDVSAIESTVIEKKNVTYLNPKLHNSVYFAIKVNASENVCFDPLNYEALRSNCKVIFTPKEIKGLNCVIVGDVNLAYQCFARLYRNSFNVKVVAITGTVGKTTTKDLIASVLSEKYVTGRTTESKNIPNAVVDNLLRIDDSTEYFALEMGSSQPGQIHKSSTTGCPNACVITKIGTSHIDLMGSQQNICNTKQQILDGASPDAPLFLNADDPFLQKIKQKGNHRLIFCGIQNQDADYRAENIHSDNDISTFDIVYMDHRVNNVVINMHGAHNVSNALIAFAIGKWANIADDEIVNGLAKYRPEGLRQNVRSAHGMDIIMDCISADTVSMMAAFDALKDRKATGRKIAVLGHIMRMGKLSRDMHRSVGDRFVEDGLDLCLCFDDDTRYVAERIQELGGNAIFFENNKYELIKYMRSHLRAGDVILFKGGDKYSHFSEVMGPVFFPEVAPDIYATAGAVYDLDTKSILFDKSMHRRMPPASLTLLMTAIVILKQHGQELDRIVTVQDGIIPFSGTNYANIGITQGDRYSIEDLLNAMVIGSAFDAAHVLVHALYESDEVFINLINQTAQELGMNDTHFMNYMGWFDRQHYSSAYDIALLCSYGLSNPEFVKIINRLDYTIPSNQKTLKTSNRLIHADSPFFYPYAKGIKAANGKRSKYCLATYGEKDGKRLISVVLGAPDAPRKNNIDKNTPNLRYSFTDTMRMLEYGFYSETSK